MLELLDPAAVQFIIPLASVTKHCRMSLKRKASATLRQPDQQHPAKRAALFDQTPDSSAVIRSHGGLSMPGAVTPQAACSAAGLGMQQQQQQQQRQENIVGDMENQVSMPAQKGVQLLLILDNVWSWCSNQLYLLVATR
jgi:hypothetical protein